MRYFADQHTHKPMNKTLSLLAVLALSTVPNATAGGEGRTICVLRSRPVAIQPAPRPVYTYGANVMSPTFRPSATISGVGPFPSYYPNRILGLRVPVVYGYSSPRLHYVSPVLRNGYVGGMQNLPTNYVNIPPNFSRAPMRPAVGRPGHHGGNGNAGGAGRAGGNAGGGGHGGGGK